ncbi:uncharacterized protein [Diadema antillarum]|uniref:uncharacterized protein n=1 Tax=Diadema antillarum TaxID=105358 RepID=UPI003A8892EE
MAEASPLGSGSGGDEVPVSLAKLASTEHGKRHFSDDEIWAICKECCSALQSLPMSSWTGMKQMRLCPEAMVFNANGNISIVKSDNHIGAQYQAPEVAAQGMSEKAHVYSIGKTLLQLIDTSESDQTSGSTLRNFLQRLTSDNPNCRPTLGEISKLCNEQLNANSVQLALYSSSSNHQNDDADPEKEGINDVGEQEEENSKETDAAEHVTSTSQPSVSPQPQADSESTLNPESQGPVRIRNAFIQQSIPDSALLKPVPIRGRPVVTVPHFVKSSQVGSALQKRAALNRATHAKMASGGGGPLRPPSLDAFGNLSERAQEILKKIYSGDNTPVYENKGTSKLGSDSDLFKSTGDGFSSGSFPGGSENKYQQTKRNSLGSTTDAFVLPRSLSLQEEYFTGRNSLGSHGSSERSKSADSDDPNKIEGINITPDPPVIKVSRASFEALPEEQRNSLQSSVTANKVSNALTKFMKSRQIVGAVSKPDERTFGGQNDPRGHQGVLHGSGERSFSSGGTDDEFSSGHMTDADLYILDDPWFETESENEGDSSILSRIRSNSIATCHTFSSKSSAFRAPQMKSGGSRKSSLSNIAEIKEEDQKQDSSYSNIKDLALMRHRSISHTGTSRANPHLERDAKLFTPIVLDNNTATILDRPVKSPIVDEAKIKAKKAMELIKLDLKAPRKEKPPPTMLQDIENDAADFLSSEASDNPVQNIHEHEKSKDTETTPKKSEESNKLLGEELSSDQKLKLLFHKHGLGSPKPSPYPSPNPVPKVAIPSELADISSSKAISENHGMSSLATSMPHAQEKDLSERKLPKDQSIIHPVTGVLRQSDHDVVESTSCGSPVFKMRSVTVVQHSPLTTAASFSPVQIPGVEDKPEILSESKGIASKSLSLATKESVNDNHENVNKQIIASQRNKQETLDLGPQGQMKLSEIAQDENKMESLSKPAIETSAPVASVNHVHEAKVQSENGAVSLVEGTSLPVTAHGSTAAQSSLQQGTVLTLDPSSGFDASSLTLNAGNGQGLNFPIQVQLQQDPQTGLFRVVPVGIPLQGLPLQIGSPQTVSSGQSVGGGSDAVLSPVQAQTPSPTFYLGTSTPVSDGKPTPVRTVPRKKKHADTSSDPDSSLLPQRQHRSLTDRKRDHTKKRAERSKYAVSPHKKALGKLATSHLTTDSESSESSFSSPAPNGVLEKGQTKPHRRKPTKASSASSSHGDSDSRKERHREQSNGSRSPRVERLRVEGNRSHARSQSKSRDRSRQAVSSALTKTGMTTLQVGVQGQSQLGQLTDDMDDTRPIQATQMPSSPMSVSMSSPSRDSGVNLRYATSSGEDLPTVQEVQLADALQGNAHLKKVIRQIRQAFAFDGYLENGVEDLHMAEYIASLASVTWVTFASAVTEKFCDLYWEEDLLEGLYEAVNGQKPVKPATLKTPSSQTKPSVGRRKSKENVSEQGRQKPSSSAEKSSKEGSRTTSKSKDRTEGKSASVERKTGSGSKSSGKRSEEPKSKRPESLKEEQPDSAKKTPAERKTAAAAEKDRRKKSSKEDGSKERRISSSSTETPRPSSSSSKRDRSLQRGNHESEERVTSPSQKSGDQKHKRFESTEKQLSGAVAKVPPGSPRATRHRTSKEKTQEQEKERRTHREKTGTQDVAASDGKGHGVGKDKKGSREGREPREGRSSRQARKAGSRETLPKVDEQEVPDASLTTQAGAKAKGATPSVQERAPSQNSMVQSRESLLSSSKDSLYMDRSLLSQASQDSTAGKLEESMMSSTSDLSASLPLSPPTSPPSTSTPNLNSTLPITKCELNQSRLVQSSVTPKGSQQAPLSSAGRRDSIASFSSTSSGTSSRTQQSHMSSSIADSSSMMETSMEEGRLVVPGGVMWCGDRVDPSVAEYAQNLTGFGDTQNTIESKILEVDQQLTLEKRSRNKTAKFYRKLQEKGSSDKAMVSKVGQDLAETTQKIEFLESAKRHLEMLFAEQWGLEFSLLYSLATISVGEMLTRRPDNPLLTIHTMRVTTTLQAGETKGLFSYLYARQALLDGYLPHFFYTYHYFATCRELLNFLTSRFMVACSMRTLYGESDFSTAIIARTLDILHVWVEGFFDIDFRPDSGLLQDLVLFVTEKIVPMEPQSKFLVQLLERRQQEALNGLTSVAARVQNSENASGLPSTNKTMPLPWQAGGGSHLEKGGGGGSGGFKATLMACFIRKPAKQQEMTAYNPAPPRQSEGFHLSEHTSQTVAQVLTLIQQSLFIKVHPVHYLNSRCKGIGVKDTTKSPYSIKVQPSPPPTGSKTDGLVSGEGGVETKSLFAETVAEGKEIRDLIDLGEVVSHWVSAEVVSSSSAKAQVAILSKFISAAKTCFELRNFATCVQILDGLDNVIVRQVPAWRDIPSKVVAVYEDLNASRILLQGDSEYLVRGEKHKTCPTLPATLLFLLHVQQQEIGGFQLTNGMRKWTKLRSIAKLVDQIRMFQEHSYSFELDPGLEGLLRQRMEEFSSQDIHVLAARHSSNYHQLSSDNKGRKLASAFQKMTVGRH